MKIINKVEKLKSNGHYALALVDNNHIYVSGQFSFDPKTGEKKFGSMEEEIKQVLFNIDLILKEAGSSKNKILKVVVYINDLDQWHSVDKTYSEFFSEHTPARTILALPKLHFGFKVEIDVIAAC